MTAPHGKFEPEITAFYCIFCGYMAADTAGAMGIQYPANVKFLGWDANLTFQSIIEQLQLVYNEKYM